eukprot:scaffold2770_cov104-Cylindrotheca_fusiformis.AAC.1
MMRVKRKGSARTQCGPLTLKTITSLLALRGLFAILASTELSRLEYSNDNAIRSLLQQGDETDPLPITAPMENFHPIHVYRGPDTAIKDLGVESLEMKQKFKPNSQVGQDAVILSLTKQLHPKLKEANERKLYFVDLAANDAIQLSNTLLLEEEGWHGLCVEPNPVYWYRLAHRKCDIAAAFVGGKTDLEKVDVSLTNEELGGIVGDKMDNRRAKNPTETRYTISVRSLFRDFQVPSTIDYMSLDVEGAEELVMEDFPFDKYKIHFLTVERPKLGLQTLLKANGYRFIMKLVSWGETLWVHDSVLESLTLEQIEETVRANAQRLPKNPQLGFNIETGTWHKDAS